MYYLWANSEDTSKEKTYIACYHFFLILQLQLIYPLSMCGDSSQNFQYLLQIFFWIIFSRMFVWHTFWKINIIVFLWSRGQFCVFLSVIKIMFPFKLIMEQIFLVYYKKKLDFSKHGVPQLWWKPTAYAASTGAVLHHYRNKEKVSEVTCFWPWSIISFSNIYEITEDFFLACI